MRGIPVLKRVRIPVLEGIAIRDEKINDLEKRLNLNSTNSHSALQKIQSELRLQSKEREGSKVGGQKTIKETPSQEVHLWIN